MDFEHSPKLKALQQRLAAFMDEHVLPAEPRFEAEMGPDEVHRNAIAKVELARYADAP